MNITRAEAGVLAEAVRKRAGYLVLLRERMEKTNRRGDPLYPAVCAAHEALHTLWVHCHYRACGINRSPKSVVTTPETPLLQLPGAGAEETGVAPHVVPDPLKRPADEQAVAKRPPEDTHGGRLVVPPVVPEPLTQVAPPVAVVRVGQDRVQ
jgi:hypothetical protein